MSIAKSCAMRVMPARVVYRPTYQRAKSVPTFHFYVPINVPTYQKCTNFSTWRAKDVPVLQIGVPTCRKECQIFNYVSSLLNCVPCVPAWSTCLRAKISTSQKRANISFFVSTCQRRANFLT